MWFCTFNSKPQESFHDNPSTSQGARATCLLCGISPQIFRVRFVENTEIPKSPALPRTNRGTPLPHVRQSTTDATALLAYQPALLVGDLTDLYQATPLADLKAVVVLSTHLMTGTDRNRLWGRFQVPTFEQLIDKRLRVLAEECEAHCGLHVLDTSVSGLRTSIECECGRTEPRIVVT